MKKFMFVMFSTFIFFLSFTKLGAITKLNFSGEEGKIQTSMTTSLGYVGAVDVSIVVTGDVTFDSVTWDESLSEYDKIYKYNGNDHILHIYITLGDKSKNLLDQNGNFNLGTLNFKNGSEEDVNFSLSLSEITIVDADLKGIEISDYDNTSNPFTISKVVKEEEKNDDNNIEDNQNNSGNSNINDSSNNTSSNNENSSNNESNQNTSNENQSNEEVNNNVDSNEENKNTTDKNSSNTSTNTSIEEESEEQDSFGGILKIMVPILIVFVAILLIIYVRKSNE